MPVLVPSIGGDGEHSGLSKMASEHVKARTDPQAGWHACVHSRARHSPAAFLHMRSIEMWRTHMFSGLWLLPSSVFQARSVAASDSSLTRLVGPTLPVELQCQILLAWFLHCDLEMIQFSC